MKKKKKHYLLDNILALKALYNVLFGERSNGKSYAVKKRCLEKAWTDNEKFVYMRRWREDIVNNRAESYWDDMEEDDDGNRNVETITGGEFDCISVYRGDIFFAKRDESGKKCRGRQIGRVVVLTGDTHEKSRAFVGYYRIIFEEFITTSGYLADEVKTFMSLVSTILRKRTGEVFLIGNTLTRTCPYFREWELVNVPRQKIGTIDLYKYQTGEEDENGVPIIVTIACEYCENAAGRTKMIFGNKMITSGEWQTDEKEHLPLLYGDYRKHYSILVDDELELFVIDILSYNGLPLLYIRQEHRKWTDRDRFDIILTERFSHDPHRVKTLYYYPKLQSFIRRLFDNGKVCYEDNLVGTSFCTLLINRKLF